MFRKILVPLDGSEVAEGILPFASALARGLDIPLALLTVVDPDNVEVPDVRTTNALTMDVSVATGMPGPRVVPATSSSETVGASRAQLEETARDEAETALRKVANRLTDEGVTVEAVTAFGSAADEIVRAAEREGCDLIAMSTHGRGMLGRGVLGSVTDKVIHSSSLPTLTITPERAKAYWGPDVTLAKIMVPLDGSELAEAALPYAEDLAKALSLEVVIVRAVNVGGFYAPYTYYPTIGPEKMETEVQELAIQYIRNAAEELRTKGVDTDWKLVKGPYAEAIVELAQKTPQDIIVMATHGRSGVTRWILGSITEGVVRASGDPVLVIPPKRDAA